MMFSTVSYSRILYSKSDIRKIFGQKNRGTFLQRASVPMSFLYFILRVPGKDFLLCARLYGRCIQVHRFQEEVQHRKQCFG